jgi:hypothetical protein
MQEFEGENIQKCVDVLEDFHSAVEIDDSDGALKEKQMQAGDALKHLAAMFNADKDDEGNGPPCRPPDCSQAPATAK